MDIHDIARQVASSAGADFAFILSHAGLLVTRDAPRDMPDSGRQKILWACPQGKGADIAHIEMPRQDLVPFGGAAPVDVFALRVEDTAVLALVMSTWSDKSNVILALTTGAGHLAEMIRKAKRARAQKVARRQGEPARRERTALLPGEPARRERASAVPAEPARRERASAVPAEPARRERASSLPRAPREPAPKKPAPQRASQPGKPRSGRRSSEPEIEIGEADVGRETLVAIEASLPRAEPQRASQPGKPRSGRRSSEPEIEVGEAPVGRETLVAIEGSLPRPEVGPTPEAVRVELDSIGPETLIEIRRIEAAEAPRAPTVKEPLVKGERRTLPWVDSAPSLKRAADAKAKARGAAPADVKLTVVEIDPEALEAALRADGER